MRRLYPPIEPTERGLLDVGDGHRIYWEVSGNPDGKPAVFLHGGPGGGCAPFHRQFFDPDAYRIVLFDQRGCGRSHPHVADDAAGALHANTTDHLVADIEALRTHLQVEKWLVFGGSWGSTLALAYAQRHPQRVTELVLRGIFLLRRKEIDWYYNGAAGNVFPDVWDRFLAPVPEHRRGEDLVTVYRDLLADPATATDAAVAWSTWESATSSLLPNPERVAEAADPRFSLAFARIENHYFVHGGFLDEAQLLRDVAAIEDISGVIVQGRYDVVCPAVSAWELHRAWPGSQLHIVDDAGHAANEPGITHHLVEATDRFAKGSPR
ncbi:MAG TPA: prolyl aminopeptidase [Aldersonia sp.]